MTTLTGTKSLAAMKARAIREIDAKAEAVRATFITPGSGQAMVYAAKEAEAARFAILDPPPASLEAFPLLAAEVGITSPDAVSLAALWLAMRDAWLVAAAGIERKRLMAKAAVDAASTPAAIAAAANVDWSAEP